MKKVMLIDGSSILSTCFFGNLPNEYLKAKSEEEFEKILPKILQTKDGFFTNGIFGFCRILKKIEEKHKPDYLAVAWDVNRNTFRKELYSEYKAHRKETRKELSTQFETMKKLLDFIGIYSIVDEGFEADDIIGSMAEKYKKDVHVIIVSKDRDVLQLIDENVDVWLLTSKTDDILEKLNLSKDDIGDCLDRCFPFDYKRFKDYYGITPSQLIDLKAVCGDKSDNIPGIPGVGEKTAEYLLKEFLCLENVIHFLNSNSQQEIDEKQNKIKALGCTRFSFKPIINDIHGENLGLMSKRLATIKTDLVVPDLIELIFNPNTNKRKRIFERLEFESLLVK